MYEIRIIQKNYDLLTLMIDVLKFIFKNPNIRKVLFDGKWDLEALHNILGVGNANIFDI